MIGAMQRSLLRGARRQPRAAVGAMGRAVRWAGQSTLPDIDPYEIFENRVSTDSTEKDIKDAYRDLVKLYHPDQNPDVDPRKITEINQAYKMLISMEVSKSIKKKWYELASGDEPPVPRSELHERVYKAAETKWEESTSMMLKKINRKYGVVLYWFAKILLEIVQFARSVRVLLMIFVLMSIVGVIKQMLAQKHLRQIRERKEKMQSGGGLTLVRDA